MNLVKNRIPVTIGDLQRITGPVVSYRYDAVQYLVFSGIELPENYVVEFCNEGDTQTTPMIGGADGVRIPNVCLRKGGQIKAYLILTGDDENAVETRYEITLAVRPRPKRGEIDPDPEEREEIDILVDRLNEAVAEAEEQATAAAESAAGAGEDAVKAEAAVAHYPKIENRYWYVWDAENEVWTNTGVKAEGVDGVGIQSMTWNQNYTLTITLTNGTVYTSASLRGEVGGTPEITIGTVTTGAAGSQATATITGTDEHPVLNLTIPRGDPGEVTQQDLDDAVTDLNQHLSLLETGRRYGVSGIGQSAVALTRLWDAVGMTAQVGTDGDNSNVVNDFDNAAPFMRRKCVGKWHLVNGVPVFRPSAYYGDADYAEDGSMGDYVAVECPRAYYYLKDGVLGVSDRQFAGWRPFDIFCRNHNPQETLEKVYLPAYALALKNGKAVSLPGLDNYQGSYKQVIDACRTYDGDVGTMAFSQPMAVNFYEWALFTVEFATQNCQNIMQGCAGLRHNADDRATLRSDGKWLLSNYQAARVVGEYVSIQPTDIDINSASYYASHRITAITRCDAEGNASSSGAYQLVETEDLGLGRAYTVGSQYRFAARPWRTGACNSVSTPSGSPVNNTSSYYPMKYRWRENVYSNQYKTVADLFNKRVGTGDSDYKLEWYYLPDPSNYEPSTTSKPDATDLATNKFVKLDVETAHANYVSGYVKSKKYSELFPDVWIPHETSGGSASTYFCDYAHLVASSVVRAVRLGGAWHLGAADGFSSLNGYLAPSSALANYGGDLFFPQ